MKPETHGGRLATFSEAVRQSSLKRFRAVPTGQEDVRPPWGGLSLADLAQHLVDADEWLFRKLESPEIPPLTAAARRAGGTSRQHYEKVLRRLDETGKQRASLIRGLDDAEFSKIIPDGRFGGPVSVWWILVRGNLDHEIHHRGQASVLLRVLRLE